MQRVGGTIQILVNGEIIAAKGAFDYNLGIPQRTTVNGQDGPHGFTEEHRAGSIEGTITDQPELDLKSLFEARDATVIIALANGKTFALTNAHFTGDGSVNTAEGEISVRWDGFGEEIPA